MTSSGPDVDSHPLDRFVSRTIRLGAYGALLREPQVQVERADGQFRIRKVAPIADEGLPESDPIKPE